MNDKFEKYSEIKEIVKEIFNDAKEKDSYIDYPRNGGGESTFFTEKYKTFKYWYKKRGVDFVTKLFNKIEE